MKDLKRNRWIVTAVVLLMPLLLLLLWPRSTPRSLSVALTGPAGLVVVGYWTVDGVRSDVRATVPTNFVTTARSLSFDLIRQGNPGTFKIQLAPVHKDFNPMSSESEYGIRGDIRFDGNHEDRLLSSFGK